VAEIIQNNCTVCHRPGGIGPMNLVSYEDARRYARRIREQVANRLMPPYYYDSDVGIQELQHDWRLSDEDIATVVAWVDQGAPLGDPADLPPAAQPRRRAEGWSLEPQFGRCPTWSCTRRRSTCRRTASTCGTVPYAPRSA
jgi:hypothetical protein